MRIVGQTWQIIVTLSSFSQCLLNTAEKDQGLTDQSVGHLKRYFCMISRISKSRTKKADQT